MEEGLGRNARALQREVEERVEKAEHQGWMGKEEMTVPSVPLVPPATSPSLMPGLQSLLDIGVDLTGMVMSNA